MRERAPEVAMHRFFKTLRTPYQVYEAEDPESLAKAVADVGRQQNFPLDYVEQLPRADFSRALHFAGRIGLRNSVGWACVAVEELGMRRRSVHLMFGAAVLACTAFAAYEGFRLREASRVNEAVARATSAPDTADLASMGALPEAQFAQAIALAKQRKYEEALERYKAVARGGRPIWQPMPCTTRATSTFARR